ncbi:MAG: hypothetical protein WBD02_01840 [Acidimicrobiia bacterium]
MTPDQLHDRIRPFLLRGTSARLLVRTARLAPKWFDAGAPSVGLRWDEWCSDAAIETMVAGLTRSGIAGAFARLGSDRANLGLTLPEANADYRALIDVASRSFRNVCAQNFADAAYTTGWWETYTAGTPTASCIDPLSGLVTAEYLAVRLSELYRAGAALDYPPNATHALVVLHTHGSNDSPLGRSRRRIEIGAMLRDLFDAGETIATNGENAFVVLLPRGDTLADTVGLLRVRTAGLPSLRDHRVDVWIEPLAPSLDHTHALISDLSRRGG